MRIGVDGPADASLTILEFSASLCLVFRRQPSTSPSVSVADSRSVQSPSPSPRELAKLKLLDPSASCLPSCSIAFWTSVIVACITSPSVVRGVELLWGSGFRYPIELVSGSSRRVCRVVGECSSGSGSWTSTAGDVGVASWGFGVVKLCGNRPMPPASVRPFLREEGKHPMLAEMETNETMEGN